MEYTIQKINNRFHNKYVLTIQLLLLVIAFSIVQDLLHSRRNDYPFYISESLLFNSFWILFIPIAYLLQKMHHRNAGIYHNAPKFGKMAAIIMAGSIAHILLYSLIVHILSVLFFKQNYLFLNNLGYTLANDFYKYPIIYGTISLFLIQKTKAKTEFENVEVAGENTGLLNKIFIQKGRESIAIFTKDIIFITSCSPYIAIQTNDKKYLHNETLISIQNKLDITQFVRIHKSSIIHIEKVKSYTSRLNGDFDVLMENGIELRLSRNYVKGFREKMAVRNES